MAIQNCNQYIQKIWFESNILYLDCYDTLLHGDTAIFAILPEHECELSQKELDDAYPERDAIVCSFHDLEAKTDLVLTTYYTDMRRIAPELWDFKMQLDTVLKPIDSMYMKNSKTYFDAKCYESAEKIVDFYSMCLEENDMDYFELSYSHGLPPHIFIIDIDNFRGDAKAQRIIVKAITYIVNSGTIVTLELWNLDSGFEVISEGIINHTMNGMVILDLKCE